MLTIGIIGHKNSDNVCVCVAAADYFAVVGDVDTLRCVLDNGMGRDWLEVGLQRGGCLYPQNARSPLEQPEQTGTEGLL